MRRRPRIAFLAALAALGFAASASATAIDSEFVGTTPCDAPVRAFLGVATRDRCEIVRWNLELVGSTNFAPAKYSLVARYGVDGQPLRQMRRSGGWQVGAGIPQHPDAVVYRLTLGTRELAFWHVDVGVLYLLDAGRNLLVGNGGYGYSLSLAAFVPERVRGVPPPELSYTLTPLANGLDVYGVFEGRTPCDIGKEIGIEAPPGCIKLKWRLTLFHGPERRGPTAYKIEGALFPQGPRAGKIALPSGGTPFDRNATLISLEGSAGERPIYLMRGDENVLFLLEANGDLPVGNGEFGYVLNRRAAPL